MWWSPLMCQSVPFTLLLVVDVPFLSLFHFRRMWWSWKFPVYCGYCYCLHLGIFHFERVLEWTMLWTLMSLVLWPWNWLHRCWGGNFSDRWQCYYPGFLVKLNWYQQVWIQQVDGPFQRGRVMWSVHSTWNLPHSGNWVTLESCPLGLHGTPQWNQCFCNVRVIGSISNMLNNQFWQFFPRGHGGPERELLLQEYFNINIHLSHCLLFPLFDAANALIPGLTV